MIDDRFRLMPEQASTHAASVDLLYYFLLGVAAFFSLLIASLIVYFSIKYRRGNTRVDRTPGHGHALLLELTWMVIPLIIAMLIFIWGARLYFVASRPPEGALEISVVAKQWMWKFQHPSGRREIDTLHVPRGQAVRLRMISEDVIHSLFVPAFRIKHDVLPGRYTRCWFHATKTGEFHLFCAEYCGTNHSRMIGRVVVLDPAEYELWLAGSSRNESPVKAGERLFTELRCATCHMASGASPRCPPLTKLLGSQVRLADGQTVLADEAYVRESILRPAAQVVAGYQPVMPSYDGQVDEEQLNQLITFIQSLGAP